jgi:hypothetical protein
MVYFKQSGHCTRCCDPFAGNRSTAFMVSETVAWTVIYPDDPVALTQREIVPVCEACATAAEQAAATRAVNCKGCDMPMLSREGWWGVTCSTRCAQRWLRRRHREKRRSCSTCGITFKTTRTDARFCSNTCRQKPHRLSRHPTRQLQRREERCEEP